MTTTTEPAAEPTVALDTPAPGVTRLTLNRPGSLNALNVDLVADLTAALDTVECDETCRVVVLTGAGRGFCAGLDLKGYGDDDLIAEQGELRRTLRRQVEIADISRRLHHLRQPVIAAVNGPAAGGGLAFALASDVRIAARSAFFVAAFLQAGYSACDLGTSWLLPRIVGTGRAHELLLTARKVDADEALRLGLVTDVVDDAHLLDTALRTAALITRHPPLSVELTKQGMWAAVENPGFDAAVEYENRQQVVTAFTEDQKEATRAFVERRQPRYRNR
ncbi:Enoyl-CoA hydratase [Jatrophihabitans endophyticus]|uniref:Enoyl-CoA hydratase n=1 Tax=Jatrophihabitans endophyticus TaxID=1206085 RepID=A0A1M5Q1K8_9ACTN|nr:enoyl-CoA hydratase-related protein [Jatrophihabitans endophyticus]SHH07599.1 Enoyl-CoA hydratase [Jatrophihabitans endophyticus]